MSCAKPLNPLILAELRRLKCSEGDRQQAKPAPDRIESLVAELTSATLTQLAALQVRIQA
jgi:hypothetical protein